MSGALVPTLLFAVAATKVNAFPALYNQVYNGCEIPQQAFGAHSSPVDNLDVTVEVFSGDESVLEFLPGGIHTLVSPAYDGTLTNAWIHVSGGVLEPLLSLHSQATACPQAGYSQKQLDKHELLWIAPPTPDCVVISIAQAAGSSDGYNAAAVEICGAIVPAANTTVVDVVGNPTNSTNPILVDSAINTTAPVLPAEDNTTVPITVSNTTVPEPGVGNATVANTTSASNTSMIGGTVGGLPEELPDELEPPLSGPMFMPEDEDIDDDVDLATQDGTEVFEEPDTLDNAGTATNTRELEEPDGQVGSEEPSALTANHGFSVSSSALAVCTAGIAVIALIW